MREVEAAVQRGSVTASVRTKFQAVALVAREERARVRADESASPSHRAEQLKRLDGIATILARTAVRDSALLALLGEDAVVSGSARALASEMLLAAGIEPAPVEPAPAPVLKPTVPTRGRPARGRERTKHDEKITVYISADELMALETARLTLRGQHGVAADRGRIVREAISVILADLAERGEDSVLVRRLQG